MIVKLFRNNKNSLWVKVTRPVSFKIPSICWNSFFGEEARIEPRSLKLEVKVKRYNLIYLGSVAIIVALGVKMVGGLLTAALVAVPASAAKNMSRNLAQYASGAMVIGIISSFLGILFFKLTRLPAGPLIILASAFIFLISMAFKR